MNLKGQSGIIFTSCWLTGALCVFLGHIEDFQSVLKSFLLNVHVLGCYRGHVSQFGHRTEVKSPRDNSTKFDK